MKLKAIGRHLLIRCERVEEKSAGGIFLAKATQDKLNGGSQVATVLDVGEFAFDDQPGVKVVRGDRIVTARYPGTQLDVDQNVNDAATLQYRVILDNEVRALESEDGVAIYE